MTRAGEPTATEKSGMLDVTTELAPITQCRPIVNAPLTQQCAPIQVSSPMVRSPFTITGCSLMLRRGFR